MSVLYTAIPVTIEIEEGVRHIFHNSNMVFPQEYQPGHNPTPVQVRSIVDAIEGCSVTYTTGDDWWQAFVDFDETYVLIDGLKFSGDENEQIEVGFQGDSEMIHRIVVEISRRCGTYFLMNDSQSIPILFMPESVE